MSSIWLIWAISHLTSLLGSVVGGFVGGFLGSYITLRCTTWSVVSPPVEVTKFKVST